MCATRGGGLWVRDGLDERHRTRIPPHWGKRAHNQFVGRRGTAWLSAMPRHPVLKTRIKGMASEKSRVIRKDLQEVLRWLRRNRAALRRKYYSSSKAKSQSDSFDKVLRYLTAIDEGDYWKSPSLDSEGTEIRLRDLMDSLNDQREESTIINVFSAFNVKVILEHASWEVGLERMIEFVSHGKNKTKEEKEKEKKKQGPDEPSSEPIHRYSEIIYFELPELSSQTLQEKPLQDDFVVPGLRRPG